MINAIQESSAQGEKTTHSPFSLITRTISTSGADPDRDGGVVSVLLGLDNGGGSVDILESRLLVEIDGMLFQTVPNNA